MKNKKSVSFEAYNFSYKKEADDGMKLKHAGNIVVRNKPRKEAGNIVFLERAWK